MFLDQIIPQDTLTILKDLAESRAFYPTMVYPALASIITGITLYLLITRQEFIRQQAARAIKILIITREYFIRRRNEADVKDIYTSLKKKQTVSTNSIFDFISMALGGIIILSILTKTLFLALVTTASMAPLIMPGDLIVAEAYTKNITVGDVIVFLPPSTDRSYVHRVTSVSENGIRTKGDNALPDSWKLSRDNIQGKAVSINQKPLVLRGAGFYFMPINSPQMASDPQYNMVRKGISTVQTFGPILSIITIFFALFTMRKK